MWMRTKFWVLMALGLAASGTGGTRPKGNNTEIEGFNAKFVKLILNTAHAGMLARWA
jgi:hypothetical protein